MTKTFETAFKKLSDFYCTLDPYGYESETETPPGMEGATADARLKKILEYSTGVHDQIYNLDCHIIHLSREVKADPDDTDLVECLQMAREARGALLKLYREELRREGS